MPELLDTFDENGNKTGTIIKGEKTTDYVKCCSCFVVNSKNQVLIEKRGKTVLDAGKLDLCSGHIRSNETSTQGMIRELIEELGITQEEAMELKRIGNLKVDFNKVGGNFKCITDMFMLKRTSDTLKLQDEEVKGIEYYDLEEALELIRTGKTRLPYDETYENIFRKLKQELGIIPKEENKNIMEK